jgi:hypothetical protein
MPALNEDNMTVANFRGLDISAHPALINDAAFSILQNVEFGNHGEIYRRRGLYIECDFTLKAGWTAGKPIEFLGTFFTGSASFYYAITVDGMPYVGTTLTIAGMTQVAGLPVGFKCHTMLQYNDIWYFLSSGNGIWRCTPSATPTATAVANSPNSFFGMSFKDRFWVIQVDASVTSALSSTIQFCAPGNPDSWTATDIAKIAPGNGDVLTYLVGFADRVICFKKNTIWNVYTQAAASPVSAIRLLTRDRGAASTRSVVLINNLIYFIAYDGLWRTDGSAFSEISIPVRPLFIQSPLRYAYDQGDYCVYYDDHIYVRIAVPTVPPNPPMATNQNGYYYLAMNVATGAWAENIFPNMAVIGTLNRSMVGRDASGNISLYQGANDRVYTRTRPYYTDDVGGDHTSGVGAVSTQPIPLAFRTKRFDSGRKNRAKRVKWASLGLDGLTASPQYTYIVDGEARETYNFDPAAVNQYGSYKIPGCGYYRTFEFDFLDLGQSPLRLDFLNFVQQLHRNQTDTPR